ncbi:MAG TPA: TlpA disulfide reductase family protein [Polyangiaceae bacterium]|nr:TlpA disulfide reductase family protein [Polyangiaceae bacterium]
MFGRISVLSLLALSACRGALPPVPPDSAGELPGVRLTSLDGASAELRSIVGHRAALVNLWAPWCDSCVSELEALNRLGDRAHQNGGVVVGVAVGRPRAEVAEFTKQHPLRFPQLVDEEFKLSDALGQRRVPTTLVVDREGRVTFVGAALDHDALAAFRKAMATESARTQ